jgi:hypothetical protein
VAAATAAHNTVRRRCERLLSCSAATEMGAVLHAAAAWVTLVAAAAELHARSVVAGWAAVSGARR